MNICRSPRLRCFQLLAAAALVSLSPAVLRAETLLFNTAYIASPNTPSNPWTDGDGKTWNYVSTWLVWGASRTYYNSTGSTSEVGWSTTKRFAYFFNDGQSSSALGYSNIISQYGLYLSTTAIGGVVYNNAEVTLSGLDAAATYNLTFYGARRVASSVSAKDASLAFSINGEAAGELLLAVGTNEAELFVQNVKSDPSGKVVIDISLPTGYDWGYLNAVKLEAIPEPGTLSMIGMGILIPALLYRRSR